MICLPFLLFGDLGADLWKVIMLEQLSWDLIKFSYAPSTLKNLHTHEKRYTEFCTVFNLRTFPITQWQLIRFGTFLSFHFKSPKSVQNYLSSLCTINELSGYGKVNKGLHFRKVMAGMKRRMRHKESRAKPFTFGLLDKILPLVNLADLKQLVCWVALIFCFHLFLRKSNLVPDARQIDEEKQFQRCDFRIHQDVMVANIKWAKNRQYGDS